MNTIEETIEWIFLNLGTVSIYVEESSKQDPLLKKYLKEIKNNTLHAQEVIIGDLHREKKSNPFTQIADFCAFSISKATYEKDYRPYKLLEEKGKLSEVLKHGDFWKNEDMR